MSSTTREPNRADEGDQPLRPVVVEQMTAFQAMKVTAAVLFVLGLTWLLLRISEILLLLVFGILLGAAVDPLVNQMRRRGFSRGQAILAIYGVILLALGVALALIVPPLFDQAQVLVANGPEYLERFRGWVETSQFSFVRTYGGLAIDRAERFFENPGTTTSIPVSQLTQALGLLTSFVGVAFTTVSALIVAYYWMTEKAIIKRLILGLFPIERRDRAHALWDEIEFKFGGWARGQVVLMLIIGVISTIAYAALGLPFWFLLGIWAGVTELIPFIGPFLGGGLAFLVAITESWEKAVIVLVFVVILQQVEGNVIVPRVMRNAVGLTPLTVILAVLVGGALLGILGAILAIPVAAAVQVLISELLRTREETDDEVARSILSDRADGNRGQGERDRAIVAEPVAFVETRDDRPLRSR